MEQLENRPNYEALKQQAEKYAREAIDMVLHDKAVVQEALDVYNEGIESGQKMPNALYEMYQKILEHSVKQLLKDHGVELSPDEESEVEEIHPDKQREMDAIVDEYAGYGLDLDKLLMETIGGDNSENDIERLKTYL